MTPDDHIRARRLVRLKLSILITLLIVAAVVLGVLLRLIEWF